MTESSRTTTAHKVVEAVRTTADPTNPSVSTPVTPAQAHSPGATTSEVSPAAASTDANLADTTVSTGPPVSSDTAQFTRTDEADDLSLPQTFMELLDVAARRSRLICSNAIRNNYVARKIDSGHLHDLHFEFLDPADHRAICSGAYVIECEDCYHAVGGNHRVWVARTSLGAVYAGVILYAELQSVVTAQGISHQGSDIMSPQILGRITDAIRQLDSKTTGKSIKDMADEFSCNVEKHFDKQVQMKDYFKICYNKILVATQVGQTKHLRADAGCPDKTDKLKFDSALAEAYNMNKSWAYARDVFKGLRFFHEQPAIRKILDDFQIHITNAGPLLYHIGHLSNSKRAQLAQEVLAVDPSQRSTCGVFNELRKSENSTRPPAPAFTGEYASVLKYVKKSEISKATEALQALLAEKDAEIAELNSQIGHLKSK